MGPVLIPLAMMNKQPLRNFDLALASGEALPLLPKAENAAAATAAVLYEIGGSAAFRRPALVKAVQAVVEGSPEEAKRISDELLRVGTFNGARVLFPHELSSLADALLQELATQFLLIALLPSQLAGTRCLVKYSFHWDCTFRVRGRLIPLLFAAGGLEPVALEVDVPGASGYDSYHLEVHVPAGLESRGLRLPAAPPSGDRRRGLAQAEPPVQDLEEGVVAHAVGRYSADPDRPAELLLCPPKGGLRRTASWITLFTALSFGIIGFLPGVQDRFLDNQGSGSALLLAAPAIVITFLNRSGENSIASTLLAPLRSFVWLCVAAFSLAAAVVVTKPEDPFMSWFWSSGAIIAAGLGGFLLVGYIVSSTRDTR